MRGQGMRCCVAALGLVAALGCQALQGEPAKWTRVELPIGLTADLPCTPEEDLSAAEHLAGGGIIRDFKCSEGGVSVSVMLIGAMKPS